MGGTAEKEEAKRLYIDFSSLGSPIGQAYLSSKKPFTSMPVINNTPTLFSTGDMGRIILRLDYDGLKREAPLIKSAVESKNATIKFTFHKLQKYPVIWVVVTIGGPLSQPLNVEAFPDIMNADVQTFFNTILEKRHYEISIHTPFKINQVEAKKSEWVSTTGYFLVSTKFSLSQKEANDIHGELIGLVNHLKQIPKNKRNYASTVEEFMKTHSL